MQYDENELAKLCERYGISYLGLFGSYARGDYNRESDIDILVGYSKSSPVRGLLSHIGVAQELEGIFSKPVDLIERDVLKPKLKSYITKDLKTLYER